MAEQRQHRLSLVLGDLTLRREDAADLYRGDPAVARQQYWEPFTPDGVLTLLDDQTHVRPGMFGVPLVLGVEYVGKLVGDFTLTVNVPEHLRGRWGSTSTPGTHAAGWPPEPKGK